MPTSRLPDVNTAIMRKRDLVDRAITAGDWSLARAGLDNMVAALPAEYRPIISSAQYDQLKQTKIYWVCPQCPKDGKGNYKEYNHEQAIKFDKCLSPYYALVRGKRTVACWRCPAGHTQEIGRTKMIKDRVLEPNFPKVVPDAPVRSAIFSNQEFDRKMFKWIALYSRVIEAQLAQYRDDNWVRTDEEEFGTDAGELEA